MAKPKQIERLKQGVSCSVIDPHAWPNHALDRTARKRRLRVSSSLRSSAAGQRER